MPSLVSTVLGTSRFHWIRGVVQILTCPPWVPQYISDSQCFCRILFLSASSEERDLRFAPLGPQGPRAALLAPPF